MALPETIPQTQPVTTPQAMIQALQAMQAATQLLQQATLATGAIPARVEQQLAEHRTLLQVEVVDPLLQRMAKIEADQRDKIRLDPMDCQEIREAVSAKVREFGGDKIHFARMYGRLHREFGVNSYLFLRTVDKAQALKYIRAYDGNRTTWRV